MQSKTKILYISNSPFLSGAELSLVSLINKINNRKSIVLATSNSPIINKLDEGYVIEFPFVWFRRSLNPFYFALCLFNFFQFGFFVYSKIRKYEFDVVYSNSLKSFFYGLFVKRILKKYHVCHLRDNVSNSFLKWLLKNNVDHFICVSYHIASQLDSKIKKTVIYSGVEFNNINNSKCGIRKELVITDDDILIANIGQITQWKNQVSFIKSAIEIIAQTDNVYFVIVGDDLSGNESIYKKHLLDLVNINRVGNRISFLGWRENIQEVINGTDILLHTAINEPFGRVVVEAMAQSKAVVAYNCGGPSEIILNNKTGYLVKPNNYMELAEKTLKLIRNRDKRLEFGKNGRDRVLNKFNVLKNIPAIYQILFNQ